MKEENKANYATPVAVIIAGLLIAGAVVYGNADRADQRNTSGNNGLPSLEDSLRPVSSDDHVRGKAEADLAVIEYSDLECPFCKIFHYTMQEVLEERGEDIAWVYRHFPLASLHQKAETEAIAAECAAKLGGPDAFWRYIDRIFDITPSNDGLDLAQLPEIAVFAGVDKTAFETCLSGRETINKIAADYDNAVAIGADGTPYVVIVGPDKKAVAIFRDDVTNAHPAVRDLANQIYDIYERNIREAR